MVQGVANTNPEIDIALNYYFKYNRFLMFAAPISVQRYERA